MTGIWSGFRGFFLEGKICFIGGKKKYLFVVEFDNSA